MDKKTMLILVSIATAGLILLLFTVGIPVWMQVAMWAGLFIHKIHRIRQEKTPDEDDYFAVGINFFAGLATFLLGGLPVFLQVVTIIIIIARISDEAQRPARKRTIIVQMNREEEVNEEPLDLSKIPEKDLVQMPKKKWKDSDLV